MIHITDTWAIDERSLTYEFLRASGPGGQNVNKVESAVQLRFDVERCGGIGDDVRRRLVRLAGQRMNSEGVVVIEAQRFRSQERNREDALERLIHLLQRAAVRPKARIKTQPSRGARERRMEEKRRRGAVKRGRGEAKKVEND